MSRPPTRQLTWQFVLRTFKRVNMIAARYGAETMAGWLVEKGIDLDGASDYMSDLHEYIHIAQKKAGIEPNAHPNGNCRQCGKSINCDHNGAIYCSRECRQRAYRVRTPMSDISLTLWDSFGLEGGLKDTAGTDIR